MAALDFCLSLEVDIYKNAFSGTMHLQFLLIYLIFKFLLALAN